MEENTNTQQTQPESQQQAPEQQPVPQQQAPEQNQAQQPEPEQKKGLMPGQEQEDELDYMGAALFALIGKGFAWVKNLISPHKVQ